jgi:hypothetical protein
VLLLLVPCIATVDLDLHGHPDILCGYAHNPKGPARPVLPDHFGGIAVGYTVSLLLIQLFEDVGASLILGLVTFDTHNTASHNSY